MRKILKSAPRGVGSCRDNAVQVGYLASGGGTVTAITRRWAEDKPRGCRLCPAGTCTAYRGVCTVLVGHRVPAELAGRYDASGLAWAGAGRPFGVVAPAIEG
ncbi:hypothetical protein [Singulisphaera sp. PoT]|uniref:hypothetical protein n=1 Tax=Singulisphaera sp. PoT TaxID=3411797 RepID=UPI003BF59148